MNLIALQGTMLIVMSILLPFLLFGLVFVLFMGRGFLGAVIKARMGSKQLFLKFTVNGRLKLEHGKYQSGMLKVSNGVITATPKSMKPIENLQLGFVFERVGATIPLDLIKATDDLQEAGINSLHEANMAKAMIEKELENVKKGDRRKKETKQVELELSNMLDNIVKINNFFQYSLNPSQMDEHISNEVNKKVKKQNTNIIMWGIVLAGIIGMVIIGIFVLGGKGCPTCHDCSSLVDAALNTCKTVSASDAARSII